MKNILLVKTEEGYREIPVIDHQLLDSNLFVVYSQSEYTLELSENELFIINNNVKTALTQFKWVSAFGYELMWFLHDPEYFMYEHRVEIGYQEYNNIVISDCENSICIEDNIIHLESPRDLYINGKLINVSVLSYIDGDIIFFCNLMITIKDEILSLCGSTEGLSNNLNEAIVEDYYFEDFPNFTRSPRIIKRTPTEKVTIPAPPKKEKPKGRLIKTILPPLLSAVVMIMLSIVMGRGIFVLMSASAVVITTVFSVTNHFKTKKDIKEKELRDSQLYQKRLLAIREKMNNFVIEQTEALQYHFPQVDTIEELVKQFNSRIYEITPGDGDFLQLDIGSSSMPIAGGLIYEEPDDIHDIPQELLDEATSVKNSFIEVRNMPTIIDLKNAHLGIVGDKSIIHEQLKLMILQMVFKQSYQDIQIICLFDEQYTSDFEWATWLPHCKISAINITGIVTTENIRDQVLGHINRILKDRKMKTAQSNKESRFLPHFIFVIDEPKLIINHSIMEYLQGNDNNLGYTIIYTTHIQSSLPENIKTIVLLDDSENGKLLINEGVLVNKNIKLKHTGNIDLQLISRNLHSLKHIQGISTQIPESITLFELFGIDHPHELNVPKLWKENNSHKTLAVPLGVRAKDDIVYLNLHEKAHGPHGLVAGTTGSGKSEIMQSYIVSLAANFHPYEVGFLLIDYKGGGMANLFSKLPHLMGTITNLDGSESARAMASIKAELKRRQAIFGDNNVNHIDQYNKLYKAGQAGEPLPHLFLISDEFAELKKEQPEFMTELVSAARIGRSLGVHLILATQKPSGVVDDQIWSNSKFKLALKVQNEGDSNEVLKTPDAASITLPGRAYLQVGNNEIYELFQSAWSGAPYKAKEEASGIDKRVYVINALGQPQLLNADLSEVTKSSDSSVTQLDAVVDYISEEYAKTNLPTVKRPWLEGLGDKLISPYISNITDVAQFTDINTRFAVGMMDIPHMQAQEEYFIDLKTDGNIAIFSSSGFGKSTTITNIILTLATQNSAELLEFHILDFGNASLIQLKNLPHTSDYYTFDGVEKLAKFMRKIEYEIQKRKVEFASVNAMNLTMYNTVNPKKLPAIVIFIDNYDAIREIGMDFEDFFMKLSRDGMGVGIYCIIAASRFSAVRYAILNNFKNKIAHFMFDPSDMTSIVGRPPHPLPEIKGRAFIKQKEVLVMQGYLPAEFTNEIEYVGKIEQIVKQINRLYTGKQPESIKMLPEILTDRILTEYSKNADISRKIIIGLDTEEVEPQGIDLNEGVNLIVGPAQSGKSNIIRLGISRIHNTSKVFLFDSREMNLSPLRKLSENITYCVEANALDPVIEDLIDIITKRKESYEQALTETADILPKLFYKTLQSVVIFIDDADFFIELTKNCKEIEQIINDALYCGINFVVCSASNRMRGYDNVTKVLKETQSGIVLGNPSDQSMLACPLVRGFKRQIDIGFVYKNGEIMKIKIPKSEI